MKELSILLLLSVFISCNKKEVSIIPAEAETGINLIRFIMKIKYAANLVMLGSLFWLLNELFWIIQSIIDGEVKPISYLLSFFYVVGYNCPDSIILNLDEGKNKKYSSYDR